MSEEADKEDRTEDPSQRRLEEAIRKGNVPQSREVSNFMMVMTVLVCTVALSPLIAGRFVATFMPFVETPEDIPISKPLDGFHALAYVTKGIGGVLLAGVLVAFLFAIVSAMAQGKFVVSSERLMPKFNRLNPIKGLARIFSKGNLVEFAKGVLKVAAIIGLTATFLYPVFETAEAMVGLSPETILPTAKTLATRLLITLALVTGIIAVADRFWKQIEWRTTLRMTKQEMKEELKNTDGDPHVRHRQKEIARSRIRRRMMADVPKATVVVMNPTHYAVALRYVHGETPAPICVAKGVDALALRIRSVAEKADVPVIEDPPLARALYPVVDVGRPIPEDQYEAVAAVISFVMSLAERREAVYDTPSPEN